jgi:MinD superfamily P-loop ATPase
MADRRDMKVAVLSSKGGTGKTIVSLNLAAVAETSVYIDCDVEEPNGHLFFKPVISSVEEVAVKIPVIDAAKCNGCRRCVDFCKFNALALIKNRPRVFAKMCHSCGGCMLLCPQKAISEQERTIGVIQRGAAGNVTVCTGELNIGEATGIPIIKRLLQLGAADVRCPVFIDCPPGSACTVMESIKDADYCLLVVEPTLFGIHNFRMVYELVRLFNKRCGVILNKCPAGGNPAEDFCVEHGITILSRIPFDHELGALSSEAKTAVWESERYRRQFALIYETLIQEVCHEAVAYS